MGAVTFVLATALLLSGSLVSAAIDDSQATTLQNEVGDTPLMQSSSNQQKFEAAAESVILNGGCDPNVCFAFDGSSSIPPEEFALQINFIQLIAAIVGADPRAMFAAAQYGRELEITQKLTSDAESFLTTVTQSTFLRAPATFIEPGVLFCTTELGRVQGEPAKLILLGDGRSNVQDRALAAQAARDFRLASNANEICAVGVGFDDPILLEQIVGRADRVFEVTDWPKVLNILDNLVAEVCNIKPGATPPPSTPAPPTTTTRLPPAPECPCQCIFARGPGDREERRALRRARSVCRLSQFLGKCQVELCVGAQPTAFKCC